MIGGQCCKMPKIPTRMGVVVRHCRIRVHESKTFRLPAMPDSARLSHDPQRRTTASPGRFPNSWCNGENEWIQTLVLLVVPPPTSGLTLPVRTSLARWAPLPLWISSVDHRVHVRDPPSWAYPSPAGSGSILDRQMRMVPLIHMYRWDQPFSCFPIC